MMNNLSTTSKKNLIVRTITAIALLAVLIPCTLYGDWPFLIMSFFISVFGVYEIIHVPGAHRYSIWIQAFIYFFVISFIYWTFIKSSIINQKIVIDSHIYLVDLFVSILGIVMYAIVLFMISIFNPKFRLSDVTYLFTVGIIFALGIQGMLFVRYFPSADGIVKYYNQNEFTVTLNDLSYSVRPNNYFLKYYEAYNLNSRFCSSLLMFFTFIGTFVSDVGAYLFGMLFGKHHMAPRISPHKTWEGFIGGMIFSIACSLGFAAIMEYCFNIPIVPGLLQFKNSQLLKYMNVFNGKPIYLLILIAVLMPIVGNIGGFSYSLIKRTFGIKDYGKIFPGHGGIIDRFDASMFNSLVISILILMTAVGWNLSV